MQGKLIVIEGADGSGKKTQTELLRARMQKSGLPVASLSFPQYGKKSAGLVEEYLKGTYGSSGDVSPYTSSLFFALDRYDGSFAIRSLLGRETHVVLDRYVDSNAGHQGGKIDSDDERETFLRWLYNLEYSVLKNPQPDRVIILHLPAEESQKRVYARATQTQSTPDIHEVDLNHLSSAEKTYLWIGKRNPSSHIVIECLDGERALSPEEIHEKIWEIVRPLVAP
jgi:dTMP kinase